VFQATLLVISRHIAVKFSSYANNATG